MQAVISLRENIDIKENYLIKLNEKLLSILLSDKTTKENLLWATNDYQKYGDKYSEKSQIQIDLITGENGDIIKPRTEKTKEEQFERIRQKAEVFTPTWICNAQNNLIDNEWFGREGVFNKEEKNSWVTNRKKIAFKKKSWQEYIGQTRFEMACGEAPYLVSRYDAVTGEYIEPKNRIGLLDRKLRVIGENVNDEESWLESSLIAIQNIYGYDWQGDNVLLARENALFTIIEFFEDKFNKNISQKILLTIAEIISWNIWQMDGVKGVVPNSCKEMAKEQVSIFGDNETEPCEGCVKNDVLLHNGVYCNIVNWNTGEILRFVDLIRR